jgi:hippurate hydrolase
VKVQHESTPPVINNPELTNRLVPVLSEALGEKNIIEIQPLMVGEDFGQYGLTPEKVPISLMWLGSIHPERISSGESIPGLHNANFYQDYPATLKTGVEGMTRMLLELLGQK